MRSRLIKWTAAFAVSAALHAGAVGLFLTQPTEIEIAGGEPTELAVIGNAFDDQVAAGDVSEEITPDSAEALDPVEEAPQVSAVQPEATVPEPATEPSEPESSEAIEPEVVTDMAAVPALPTAEAEVDETPQEEPDVAETVQPTQPEPVEPEVAPAEPEQDVAAVDQPDEVSVVEPETLEPLPEDELALVDVPLPTPRPAYTPPPEPRRQPQQAQQARQQQQQPVRQQPRQQGSGGQNQADSRRGSETGNASSGGSSSGQGAQATAAGNAAVSNYPGQVASRLRRSLRYPREAQRQGIRGEVHVRFTVASGGQVSGVSIARSSGSPVLDQAAVQTVQRAAPFPAIPAAAGRNSWPFTVPLVFSR